jgi:hypothetical protein
VQASNRNDLAAVIARWSTAFFVAALFGTAEPALGQTLSTSQKYSLGVKAAPHFTIARYRDKDFQDQFAPHFTFGYTVGGQIKFPLKDNYAFLTEVGFAQKGRSTEFNEGGRNRGVYYFLDGSMALRKSFRVKMFKNVPTNMYVNVGPNIEYWLGGTGSLTYNPGGTSKYAIIFNEEPTSDFSNYYYNNVNLWLFGIDIGFGGDAPLMGRQKIYYEFRTTIGQTQLGKKNSSTYIDLVPLPYDNLLAALITFQFQLTYTFEFDTRASKKGKSTHDKDVKKRR